MPSSHQFRVQHEELLAIAKDLAGTLDAAALAKDATAARAYLTKLIGSLSVHLAMEDKVLYPTLAKSADPMVRDTSVRFEKEMGDIGNVVNAYKTQWATAQRIQSAPADFVKQTNEILKALGARIDRENNQLYPLLDKS